MLPNHQSNDHKENKKKYYSGKKKRHTLKSQVIVDNKSKKVICTNFSNGKKHDFRIFKESFVRVQSNVEMKVDSGYQGLQKIHAKTSLPRKKTKVKPLSKEDKLYNKQLSSVRVLCENVIGMLKRFKIIADKYRNRRKRFGLRFNLIAGIYNFEL